MKTVSVHTEPQPQPDTKNRVIVQSKIGFSCTQREKGVFPATLRAQKKKKKKSKIIRDTQGKREIERAPRALGLSACQDWPTSERSSLDKKSEWEVLQKYAAAPSV